MVRHAYGKTTRQGFSQGINVLVPIALSHRASEKGAGSVVHDCCGR